MGCVQEMLEAEMTDALGAEKGEHTTTRRGHSRNINLASQIFRAKPVTRTSLGDAFPVTK